MNYKKLNLNIALLLVMSLLFLSFNRTAHAEDSKKTMLITYMTMNDEPSPHTYLWEATFSAFADKVIFLPVEEVTLTDIEGSEVLVFLGEDRGAVPQGFRENIAHFEGEIVAFGHNVEQLSPFEEWQFIGEAKIRTLDDESLPTTLSVTHVRQPKKSEVLSVGQTLHEEIPVISQKEKLTYVATTQSGMMEKIALSRSIYKILNIEPPQSHTAYLRLEDVSPIADAQLVQEAGEYLAERNIPFYMTVNPVYVNHQTGEYKTLAENKELVEVLRKLQNKGGMVIVHGYTQTYYEDETGKGYEFWDIAFNQKITKLNPNEEILPVKSKSAFSSTEAYESYMEEINAVERIYIEEKLSKAIEEIVELGLYPISFEPPHYAMSLSGYDVTSEYFSSIFGHLQLSDEDIKVTNVPLFASSPAVTNRMTNYPETIGFVDLNLEDPLEEMEKSIRQLEKVPGSMIGGYYHPYVGIAYLAEVVELIESVGNVKWLDLRETAQFVKTDRVEITSENGESLQVTKRSTKLRDFVNRLKNRPLETALWGISAVVVLFLVVFLLYIASLRVQLRKRLFEEREFNR